MTIFKDFIITVCVCSVIRGVVSIMLPASKNIEIVDTSINIIFSFAIVGQIVEIIKNII